LQSRYNDQTCLRSLLRIGLNRDCMQTNKGGAARLISLHVPDHILRKDLKIFKQKAIDLGASLVEIIPANWVEIDERVRLKCSVPLCPHYGKNIYCPVLDGGNCPYPLKARHSMEGVGMDVYGLVKKVGWDIYPIYRSVNPEEVPSALSVGIVFMY
jgi:hypothetical protein